MHRFYRSLLLCVLLLGMPVQAQLLGQSAPDFALVNEAGELLRLSDFIGVPIILNFWASWCAPCVEELPLFQEIMNEVNTDETAAVHTILVNNGEVMSTAEVFLRDTLGITLLAVYEADGQQRAELQAQGIVASRNQDVLRDFRVRGMPTTYFIDAEGIIRAQKIGLLFPAEAQAFLAEIGLSWQP